MHQPLDESSPRTCERCGTTESVKVVCDPYLKEIYDEERVTTLCDACYSLYCDEI